jgi:hypothetical protein
VASLYEFLARLLGTKPIHVNLAADAFTFPAVRRASDSDRWYGLKMTGPRRESLPSATTHRRRELLPSTWHHLLS